MSFPVWRNIAVRAVVVVGAGTALAIAEMSLARQRGLKDGFLLFFWGPALHIANYYASLLLLGRFDAWTDYRFTITLEPREERTLFIVRACLFVLLFAAQCFCMPILLHAIQHPQPAPDTEPNAAEYMHAGEVFYGSILLWLVGIIVSLLAILIHGLIRRHRRGLYADPTTNA